MPTSFAEVLHKGFQQVFDVTRMLVDERTEYQAVKIFDTPLNGRVMTLDNIVQITTKDEYTYSEMLTHLPIFELRARGKSVERVLIVGGGDCAIAEEALKHKDIKEVVLAEIDQRVVDLCREYFSDLNAAAFADPRFTLQIGDAFEYLKDDKAGKFDIIIADRPDPVGPAEVLFADAFYTMVSKALTPHGIATFQTGAPFYQPDELADTMPQLAMAFEHSGAYLTVTPTYTGGFMTLTWASNGCEAGALELDALKTAFTDLKIATDYYSPAVHAASFAMPPWIERILRGARTIPGEKPGQTVRTG